MVCSVGIEPTASKLGPLRSIQLSYEYKNGFFLQEKSAKQPLDDLIKILFWFKVSNLSFFFRFTYNSIIIFFCHSSFMLEIFYSLKNHLNFTRKLFIVYYYKFNRKRTLL